MDPGEYLFVEAAYAVPEIEVEIQEDATTDMHEAHLPRGGARTARMNPTDPRTAMMMWAMQKIIKEVLHMNTATANMLLRAETRTVTMVLNSRSKVQLQLVEVLDAALRRSGLPPMSSASGSQLHPQQQPQPQPPVNLQQQALQPLQDQQPAAAAPCQKPPAPLPVL